MSAPQYSSIQSKVMRQAVLIRGRCGRSLIPVTRSFDIVTEIRDECGISAFIRTEIPRPFSRKYDNEVIPLGSVTITALTLKTTFSNTELYIMCEKHSGVCLNHRITTQDIDQAKKRQKNLSLIISCSFLLFPRRNWKAPTPPRTNLT